MHARYFPIKTADIFKFTVIAGCFSFLFIRIDLYISLKDRTSDRPHLLFHKFRKCQKLLFGCHTRIARIAAVFVSGNRNDLGCFLQTAVKCFYHFTFCIDKTIWTQLFQNPFFQLFFALPMLLIHDWIFHCIIEDACRFYFFIRMNALFHLQCRIQINDKLHLQSVIKFL